MLTRAPRRSAIDAASLFAPLLPFSRIGLAVSGGPDSLALMVMAAGWARHEGKALVVYTVDHGLRPEAAGECAMVAREAQALGLSCRVLVWTGTKPKMGIQAAARRARYRLIGEAMRKDGAEILVTAHHRNDQAETVMMRLAHGSGVSGLAGMARFAEAEGVRICRPLLAIAGAHLRDIAAEAGLRPAADPSNEDMSYERVRWRRLMPALAGEGLDAIRLSLFSARMARAEAALEAAADTAFAQLAAVDGFGLLSLPTRPLFALSPEIGLRLLGRAVSWAGGGAERTRLAPLEAAYAALASADAGFASTLGGAVLFRSADVVSVFREAGRMPDLAPVALGPNQRFVWDGRFTISCAASVADGLSVAAAGDRLTRAEAEALCGPIAAPMRAVAATPVIRDRNGSPIAIGTLGPVREAGVAVDLYLKANASKSGHAPGTEAVI